MERNDDNFSEEDDDELRESPESESPNKKEESRLQRNQLTPDSSGTNIFGKQWIIIAVVIIMSASAACFLNTTLLPPPQKEPNIKTYLINWKNNFPNQGKELWSMLNAQIMDFMSDDNVAPLVLVLVYNDASRETVQLLASTISSGAVQLKHSNDKCGDTNSHKLVGSAPLIKKGYLLEKHLSQIQECKKLIIYNLEEMLPSAAADLHSLLDPEFPNVKNGVYIFTLRVPDNCKGEVYQMVDKILEKQWGAVLGFNTFEPLMSRLVNFIKIVPE